MVAVIHPPGQGPVDEFIDGAGLVTDALIVGIWSRQAGAPQYQSDNGSHPPL